MCHTLPGRGGCCKCIPYQDGFAIAAPIVAAMAYMASWGGFGGVMWGFISFVLFMSSCCCSMNQGGLITTGVFGIFAAIISLLISIALLASDGDNGEGYSWFDDDDDDNGEADDWYYNITIHTDSEDDDDDDEKAVRIVGGVVLASAILWIVASVLLFVFVCTRYDKLMMKLNEQVYPATTTTALPAAGAAQPVVIAQPYSTSSSANTPTIVIPPAAAAQYHHQQEEEPAPYAIVLGQPIVNDKGTNVPC